MRDAKVQHQRHWAHRIREVASQLDVPTMLTPASSHLLRFHFVCCAEKIRNLVNRPVVSLLSTRVGSTSAEVVTKSISLEIFATTSRERLPSNNRDLGAHGRGKECLTETSRPGFISTMRPNLPQPTHRLEKKDTLWGILCLRLQAGHLRPKGTASSTVATMRCWERRFSCSARHESANISLRSRKVCQWLSIC